MASKQRSFTAPWCALLLGSLAVVVACSGDEPEFDDLTVEAFDAIWPHMLSFSELSDTASAVCFARKEVVVDSAGRVTREESHLDPGLIRSFIVVGPANVDFSSCWSERDRIWYGSPPRNAYYLAFGPLDLFPPDSAVLWASYVVNPTDGVDYACTFLREGSVWVLRECGVRGVA